MCRAGLAGGHSNKYHDGFLGHSYIGAWVNLAAGTQTSDLRGSVVGAFSNVLPAGFLLPPVVPSFCQVNHGQIQERLDMRQLFTTAATVMRRRGEIFTDVHRDFFYWLYDHTAELRHHSFRESERRSLRRSV